MKVKEIYAHYHLPVHMQRHMLTTAAIVKNLCDNWTGPKIDPNVPLTVMLLHDLGNVVGMDFSYPEFIVEDKKSVGYWQRLKEDDIQKYGDNEHLATVKKMKELGLKDERIFWVFEHKKFIYNEMLAAGNDYEVKMCTYSDMISAPSGVVSLDERYEEAKKRGAKKPRAGVNHPRSEYMHLAAHEIEKQLFKYSFLEKEKLPGLIEDLVNYEIEVPALSGA